VRIRYQDRAGTRHFGAHASLVHITPFTVGSLFNTTISDADFIKLFSYHIKEDEMGRIHSMHGRGEKCIQNIGWKAKWEEITWKNKA